MADISEPLYRFVREHVTTVAALDVLLLLHAHAERDWTPGDIALQLRGSDVAIADYLDYFVRVGLVQRGDAGYRFNAGASSAPLVAQLVDVYNERPVTLVNLIYAGRKEALRLLADAFKLKKD